MKKGVKELRRYLSYMGKRKYIYWTVFVITLATSAGLDLATSHMNKLVFNGVEYANEELFTRGIILCGVLLLLRCLFPYLRYFQISIVRESVLLHRSHTRFDHNMQNAFLGC